MHYLRIDAVLFDFDGTLTEPGPLDFGEIRRALGIDPGKPILEHIRTLKDPKEQERSRAILNSYELKAASESRPYPGAEDYVLHLSARGIIAGILTRNTRAALDRSLANFHHLTPENFGIILTRDDVAANKPEPDGILQAAEMLKLPLERLALVGDFLYDIQAGKSAGILTILLSAEDVPWLREAAPDHHVRNYTELRETLDDYLPLFPGKLPAGLLKDLLARIESMQPPGGRSLLTGPGTGEDAAVLNPETGDYLAVKSDPITFTETRMGYYAAVVNANDLACTGAVPRYFTATMLFPPGTTYGRIKAAALDLAGVLVEQGIELCGGHTEITTAVTRPVLAGTMLGYVKKEKFIRKDSVRPGDLVLLTKHPGVEGTAILAEEIPSYLLGCGLTPEELTEARNYRSLLSIRPEAETAAEAGFVSALHDVTEGGLVSALRELAEVGKHNLRIDMDRIPGSRLTEKICRICGIDSLGLIGSGSLLLCLRPDSVQRAVEALEDAGIKVSVIGTVLEEGREVFAYRDGKIVRLPDFAVDELARFLTARQAPV